MKEVDVAAKVRLDAAKRGWKLLRNNVGVLIDSRGIPVRFGLANESAQMNKTFKSADYIGIKPVLITQGMVGSTIGQFASVEVKASDWKPSPSDARYQAQRAWANWVIEHGGYAVITTGELE